MDHTTGAAREPGPLVRRVYVRHSAAETRPSAAPPAWPGPGWVQWPAGDAAVPGDGEVLAIIDADASSPDAALRSRLPSRVDALHFYGRTTPSRAWLEEAAELRPASLALDAPPPADGLAALTACGATLTELRLGRTGIPGPLAVGTLALLSELPGLVRLHLHNVDLRGALEIAAPLPLQHLVARLDRAPRSVEWPWPGLEWLGQMPELRSVELSVPDIAPDSLRRVAALSRVESLALARCHVTAEAIRSWQSLSQLRELDLAHATVRDGAIAELAAMPRLKTLRLAEVALGAPELHALAKLDALAELVVDNGTIRAEIGSLAPLPLRRLRLPDCAFEGAALAGLERLGGLESLDLSWTDADEAAVAATGALPLAELSLNDCEQVTLAATGGARAFVSLESLEISNTHVDAAGLRALARLPRLATLRAADLRRLDPGAELAFAPSLKALQLDRDPVGLDAIRGIAACGQLEELSLEGCALTDDEFEPLATLAGLRSLRLTPAGALPAWLSTLPQLEELVIEGAELSDERLEPLHGASALVRLELRRCHLQAGTGAAIRRLPRLEVLSLAESRLTGTGVLGALPPTLRRLDVSGSDARDDDVAGLTAPALETFAFSQTAVTVAGLLKLGATPRLDALRGRIVPASELERERLLVRFPACWTLLDLVPTRVPGRMVGADR